jgi:CheY-like chemotaxis protein
MLPERYEDTALTGGHVLLVEDEVVVRALLADELRGAGLCVVEAANADEAWAYLQAGGPADLVFSDVRMPGSMDGIELRRRVRAEFPSAKIIITSGNAGQTVPGEVDAFLQKPYSFNKAVEITVRLLGREG